VHDASLSRKINAPALPQIMLHRQALVERLQEAIVNEPRGNGNSHHYKLVLCCAPAGYGKTTLLADFARSTSLACCWYFLDRADTDPVVFLQTLLASLRRVFPSFGQHLDLVFGNLFSKQGLPTSGVCFSALDALCAALATEISEPFVLFLCNYEEINESERLTELVNALLKQLPSQATLVLESRIMPDLAFAQLLVRDEMGGLNRAALRFSAKDIAELARLHGLTTLSDEEAEQLATSFDGWITGILLGTRLADMRFLLPEKLSAEKEGSSLPRGESSTLPLRKNLVAYLAKEVFGRDPAIAGFLQAASILQEMEPGMCNTLLERTDAAEHLAHLERHGLFVTSHQSASHVVYTCHPVIRDLLSEQLRQAEPARFCALHRRAAELWCADQQYEQAMYHAGQVDATDLQVQLLLDASRQFLQQGKLETLARWLRLLPYAARESHPLLLLIQATIALAHGQQSSVLPLLEKATTLIPSLDTPEKSVLRAEIDILRAKALCQAGAYLQAQDLCEHALGHLPDERKDLRAAAEMRLGICCNLQGQFSAGITHLQQALHIWASQPPPSQAIDIHSALANTYYLIGNFALAEHHLTHALHLCEQVHDHEGQLHNLILQGILAQNQGAYAEAEEAFSRALALARAVPHSQRGEAYALVNLGSLSLEQGSYMQAFRFSEEGLGLAHQWGNRSLVSAALSNLALIHLFLGDPPSALHYVEKIEGQASSEQTVGYEWAWRELTYGMILLAQGRYQQARARLAEIEAQLRTTDLKRGIFQAKLRLAACHLTLDQPEESVRLLEEAALLLASSGNYTHLVLLELQWLPALLPIVEQHPQLASLRNLLGLEEPLQSQAKNDQPSSNLALTETGSPKLTILAFGEPAVLLDEQPITRWRMARTMELFFFLLERDQPTSKESILTALWPEFDEQTNQTFHSTLHHLRKVLGEACIVFRAGGYSLDLAACYGDQVFYDVRAFQRYRLEAEQALARQDETGAREAFLNLVALYRGDYGRPFYNNWCTLRRDELRATYLEARRQLAKLAWHAEAWSESAEHWRHMLLLDNCLEEAHYGLIRCYLHQGKRGAALRQYQSCQKILQQELGIQPGPALQHLYERLTAK